MNVSPPIPWRDVPVGAVVLIDGTARTVLDIVDSGTVRLVLAEGIAPFTVWSTDSARLVLLDDADAVAVLTAAGLIIELIKES